jgi:dipeptidyl aminopeptidase/acylaminoacyl peptidase
MTQAKLRIGLWAASVFVCAASASLQSATVSTLRQERDNLVLEGVPTRDAALADKLHRFLNSRDATFLDWLPDGSMLISTRFGNTAQVHRLTAPMAMREQLTFYPEPITNASAPQTGTPDGYIFFKDVGGNENAQIHYQKLSDHSERVLTDGKSLHGSAVWSNDGKRVAFYGNGRDGVSYDVYVSEPASGQAPRLAVAARDGAWYPQDWSVDDQKLLLLQYMSISEAYLYTADVASGAVTPLDTSGKKVGIRSALFSPDGRGVYFVSDEMGEFAQLRFLDLYTKEIRELTQDIPWDIDEFDVSPDGRYVAYVANDDGRSRLTVIDNQLKTELSPPGLPAGRITSIKFDRTGKRLALSVEGPQQPRDIYVFTLDQNAIVRWTKSEIGPLDVNILVPAELVRYPTWDKVAGKPRMISAYMYTPKTPGPHPVVINIHGGPEAQYRPGFEPFFQFLVNELGYAVIAPNVRGSSGYGKSFLKLDDGKLREDAVKDIGSLLAWIGLQQGLDRERVVVMGGSYGGYMSLASLATYNDRLRGGVDVVGISNFVSFLERTSAYRQDLRRAEYGDERNPQMRAFLQRISPLNKASAIRRPLLVVQGLNDPRVPASESEQMVASVRANGGEVWYLAAKDEGHGFKKKSNRDFYLETVAMFLQRLGKK